MFSHLCRPGAPPPHRADFFYERHNMLSPGIVPGTISLQTYYPDHIWNLARSSSKY